MNKSDITSKDKSERIKELVELLNEAGKSYYAEGTEIMSNFQYDALYDELAALENETGYILSNSPTINVGYEVLSELPKERHESPMLSLDKTKEPEALKAWLKNQKGLLSWKLDGLTIVLTYNEGSLVKAVTRGNGEVGEIITNNARVFKNLPVNIPYRGKLIIRGEAIITYSDFNKINEIIPEADAKYKNPRNLCSGSVRQLNNKITAERNVNFFAFSLVEADGVDFHNSREEQFKWLNTQGFDVVGYKAVDSTNILETVGWFEKEITNNDFPSDGLVIIYDDIEYGNSLGRTAKFPRNAYAFKWTDETAQTVLKEIEWSASRTGLINPVAIFEPVDLEGTKVSRASVHNISIMEGLKLGIGDEIKVFKANMIIPQIAENLTQSGNMEIPKVCPVCGKPTQIKQTNDVKSLYCMNPDCQAKHVKSFAHFVSRDAMNMDGLSEATLEKFIQHGFLKKFKDLFHLGQYKESIITLEGFGSKSFDNLMASIEKSRRVTLPKFIYGLGIDNIGLSNAKMIVKELGGSVESVVDVTRERLVKIDGVGDVIADSFASYFEDDTHRKDFYELLEEVELEEEKSDKKADTLEGKTFVITGAVSHFPNRNALKELIEQLGGKATGSVTKNTSYLINNDAASASSKNKTAAKLGVPVITEEEFLALAGRQDLM
ncbi:MAG: NAD-dependent DNA ligase LigA [Eubacteriales bacterium]|nr:NAD-dependent DNA ligase LigA [Eubacteriales bacterium]